MFAGQWTLSNRWTEAEILGRQIKVAGDDHRPGRHQQAGHRLGAQPLQRLVEEGADRQRDGGERLVAGLTEHDVAVARERVAHAGEEQQVELDERQTRVAARPGAAVGVEANERPRQREHRHRAPGEEPEAELADQRFEGVGRRAAARNATHQPGILAGHDVAETDRQQHQGRHGQQREGPETARAQPPGAGAERTLGRDVGTDPRLCQRAGSVLDGGGGNRDQPLSDRQRRRQRQERQHHARHGAASQEANDEAEEAEQQNRAGGGDRRAARHNGRARPAPAPARR